MASERVLLCVETKRFSSFRARIRSNNTFQKMSELAAAKAKEEVESWLAAHRFTVEADAAGAGRSAAADFANRERAHAADNDDDDDDDDNDDVAAPRSSKAAARELDCMRLHEQVRHLAEFGVGGRLTRRRRSGRASLSWCCACA